MNPIVSLVTVNLRLCSLFFLILFFIWISLFPTLPLFRYKIISDDPLTQPMKLSHQSLPEGFPCRNCILCLIYSLQSVLQTFLSRVIFCVCQVTGFLPRLLHIGPGPCYPSPFVSLLHRRSTDPHSNASRNINTISNHKVRKK